MSEKEKQTVRRTVTTRSRNHEYPVTLELYGLETDLPTAIQNLQFLYDEYKHLGELYLELEYVPYTDGEEQQLELKVKRLETDEEYHSRLERERRAQEVRIAAEKKHLAELQKKYGEGA